METLLTRGGQISTIRLDSPIAQLVEQRTVNPCVPGSSPGWGAKFGSQILAIKSGFFILKMALTRLLPWLTHPLILFFICVCFPHSMRYQAQVGEPHNIARFFRKSGFFYG